MHAAKVKSAWLAALCLMACPSTLQAGDQPQWGRRHTRNMVSDETGLPDGFDPGKMDPNTGKIDLATTRNVKWVARLGEQACGTPAVAGGEVYLGTCRRHFWVLAAGKELNVISHIRLRGNIAATPVAANGVLYITTYRRLYAVAKTGGR